MKPTGAPSRSQTVSDPEPESEPELEPAGLTARQLDILSLIAGGLTSTEIAAKLHISQHTEAQHVGDMLRRHAARSRSELVARAYAADLFASGVWPPHPRRQPQDPPEKH